MMRLAITYENRDPKWGWVDDSSCIRFISSSKIPPFFCFHCLYYRPGLLESFVTATSSTCAFSLRTIILQDPPFPLLSESSGNSALVLFTKGICRPPATRLPRPTTRLPRPTTRQVRNLLAAAYGLHARYITPTCNNSPPLTQCQIHRNSTVNITNFSWMRVDEWRKTKNFEI